MKIQILQEELAKALTLASRFVNTRTQLPILSNILLETEKNKLLVSSTNLEISVSIAIGAKVEKEGKIAVPARTITDLVNNLKPGQLSINAEKEHLLINTSGSKLTILGMNASEFPALPKTIGNDFFSFTKNTFSESLSQVIFATSIDESRPSLTGVLFSFDGGKLTLVATDGFRLSKKIIGVGGIPKAFEKESLILPRLVLMELSKGFGGEDLKMELVKKDNQAVFSSNSIVLSSRVMQGEFPNYERIIPKESTTKVLCDKEELMRVVKLASVFAKESSNMVKVKVEKNAMKVMAESSSSGSQESDVEVKVEGEPLEISFNFRFIEEFLASIKGEEVEINLTNSNSPGVFRDTADSNLIHLIMPVRI